MSKLTGGYHVGGSLIVIGLLLVLAGVLGVTVTIVTPPGVTTILSLLDRAYPRVGDDFSEIAFEQGLIRENLNESLVPGHPLRVEFHRYLQCWAMSLMLTGSIVIALSGIIGRYTPLVWATALLPATREMWEVWRQTQQQSASAQRILLVIGLLGVGLLVLGFVENPRQSIDGVVLDAALLVIVLGIGSAVPEAIGATRDLQDPRRYEIGRLRVAACLLQYTVGVVWFIFLGAMLPGFLMNAIEETFAGTLSTYFSDSQAAMTVFIKARNQLGIPDPLESALGPMLEWVVFTFGLMVAVAVCYPITQSKDVDITTESILTVLAVQGANLALLLIVGVALSPLVLGLCGLVIPMVIALIRRVDVRSMLGVGGIAFVIGFPIDYAASWANGLAESFTSWHLWAILLFGVATSCAASLYALLWDRDEQSHQREMCI
jgi:hypothetical protein